MGEKVNLREKAEKVTEHWSPELLGQVNNIQIKMFKAEGEFGWHAHEQQDELFLVLKGELHLQLRDRVVVLNEGEFFIVPRGVEHSPRATEETTVLLVEPEETIRTGDKGEVLPKAESI